MLTNIKLKNYLNNILKPYDFKDYCPNGLQIEGKKNIKKISFAVSATRESIEKAVELNSDALIVHHGLFWKFHGVRTLTGPFYKRIAPLIKNDINLFGYHLPLDAHIEYGNAACLAKLLNLSEIKPFGDHQGMPTGVKGKFNQALPVQELESKLKTILNHSILTSAPQTDKFISSMGIITGGANGDWIKASKDGLDSYLTGEMSEHDWHEAKESDITMFAGGHHATEKFGIQEIQKLIQEKFEIETYFIDSKNPA